jgi:ATP-dependent DNA helicase Rep
VTTPKRGVGNTTLERLGAWAAQRQISLFAAVYEEGFIHQVQPAQYTPLRQFCDYINDLQHRAPREAAGPLLQEILTTIDFEVWLYENDEPRPAETKWKNVLDLVGWIGKKGEEDGKNLIEISQTIALMTLLESRDEEEVDAVKLSTLHASKGLEYPHVFLIGCEEEILPHRESMEGDKVEEERRLMYVGITRAQRSLTISYCGKRRRAGEWQVCEPSRFLKELPAEDIRVSGRLSGDKAQSAVTRQEGRAMLAGLMAKLG